MHFLLLGVDSLIACIAICAIVDRRSRLPLAVLFGVADAVGFLIGAGLGWQLSAGASEVLQTGALVVLGLNLLVIAAATDRVVAWPVWVVPWALTLDNLTYGLAGDGTAGSLFQQAGEQALSSAVLALTGLLVAVALPRAIPAIGRRAAANRVAGGALILAAGGLVLLG